MRLREKLVLIFFLLIIIPMIVVSMRWQNTAVGSIKSVLREELWLRTRDIADRINEILREYQAKVIALNSEPSLKAYVADLARNPQALPSDQLVGDLSAFLLGNQYIFSEVIGTDSRGIPIFKFGKVKSVSNNNGVTKPYYQIKGIPDDNKINYIEKVSETRPDAVYTSETVIDSTSPPHVKLIIPLRDATNKFLGSIVVKATAESLFSQAAATQVKPATYGKFTDVDGNQVDKNTTDARKKVIILNPDGLVLYSGAQTNEPLPYNQLFPDYEKAMTNLKGEADKDQDWEPILIRHRLREASPKLSIFVIENYSNAVAILEFSSYILFLLAFVFVLVALLALYYYVSKFTDTLRSVTKGAKAISSGNFNYQIEIKGKDESRILAEAFNKMSARIRELIRNEGETKQFESFARLSAMLTHDLKNQIQTLSFLVSNMQRKGDRVDFREDAMKTLSETVTKLQNLVSKLSDPRTPTKRLREKSNITHLVERVIHRTAAQTSPQFKVSAQLTPELFSLVDGKSIEQVVENLVINAIEAMQPEGGFLRVGTRADNGSAIISVIDTGKGMTDEFIRERLFHPFATTKKKGIGLGLYSCRDIIEQHGGRIEVSSQLDNGTEFKIVLPIYKDDASLN